MPKYLFKSSLNVEGVKGTLAEGGTSRREAVKAALEAAGGSLEAFYYAFGPTDTYTIVDLPSHAHAIAASAAVAASGTGSVETVVLIEPEVMDDVSRLTMEYRPPGG